MNIRQQVMWILLLLIVAIVSIAPDSAAQRGQSEPIPTSDSPGHRLLPGETARTTGPARAPADDPTQVLGSWTFDGVGGTADPQGWTTADATAQLDKFFHVDDFAGLGGGTFGGLVALQGSKSMWCGIRPADTLACHYATSPGYGANWDQRFESVDFAVTGTVTLSYQIYYDSEPDYDITYVEYLSATGSWNELDNFDDRGTSFVSSVIPPDSINGVARIRFRFVSDVVYCDEDGFFDTDGAVIIDSLVVRDGTTIIDYQDFETESVGALVTADGHWSATIREPYGDFAALFDGATVVQEDSLVTNTTHLWGFFDGSTETYDCGGFPLQPAVPKMREIEGRMVGIHNEIISPMVSLSVDTSGAPLLSTDGIALEFDIYRDLAPDDVMFYAFRVRSIVGGCTGPWRRDGFVYRGFDTKEWYRFGMDISQYIDPGATHVQVAIQARDLCPTWCGIYGSGDCHSAAPLIDNVEIHTVGADFFTVTNADTAGPGSLHQAIRDANRWSAASTISFDIPGPGPHTINLPKPLPVVTGPTVIDGATQPGYAGSPRVTLMRTWVYPEQGSGIRFQTAGNSAVFGLAFEGFGGFIAETAIHLASDSNTVQANRVTNGYSGVAIEGNGNMIGGLLDSERNEITGTSADGVLVWNGTGNTIRGNIISGCGQQGIDLGNDGRTLNDALDADTGANDLQNYPVLTSVTANTGSILGTLDSEPVTEYEIDFYANLTGCAPAGYEEGARHLGSTTVITDGAGHAAFNTLVPGTIQPYEAVTATATNPSGSTSEFSACLYDGNWIVVSNTSNSGAGSLRQAILDANLAPGLSFIGFNIPGSGPHTIAPTTLLPAITYPASIEGYSQPGSSENTSGTWEGGNAVVKIFLDGSALAGSIDIGLQTAADGCTIRGLAIGNFSGYGIDLNSSYNTVEGCYLGTDASGTIAAPNYVGVSATVNCDNNMIGGSDPATRNVISGNNAEGVVILTAANNTVQGNFIGVDATGTSGLGNGAQGVRLGKAADDRIWLNVISANGAEGLAVRGPTVTHGTLVRSNRIGTDVTGTAALGNGAEGIRIYVGFAGGIGITIGGAPGYKNLIAHNTGAGVSVELPELGLATVSYNEIHSNNKGVVVTDPGIGTTHTIANIIGNSIYSNTGLGIDLADDGVSANDVSGDPDTGPNNLQNFPVLTSATANGTSIQIPGSLASSSDTRFSVEFFSNSTSDPGGYGEGAVYLGSANIWTTESGNATFDISLPVIVPGGHYISSTARPYYGNGTSEFSLCVQYFNSTTGTDVEVNPVDEDTGESPVTLTFDNITGTGNTSLTVDDTGPAVSGSYILGDTTQYWNLTTTAVYTDSIEVCFTYDETTIAGPESDIVLLHWDDPLIPSDYVDIPTSLDTIANVVCGRTATL